MKKLAIQTAVILIGLAIFNACQKEYSYEGSAPCKCTVIGKSTVNVIYGINTFIYGTVAIKCGDSTYNLLRDTTVSYSAPVGDCFKF